MPAHQAASIFAVAVAEGWFLPADVKEHRLRMARRILETHAHGRNTQWWSRNVVWLDPCASILPRTRRQYDRMRQADLGNKRRYISDDARSYSRNLRGPKEALKQASHEAMRISWVVVLARGKVAIEMLPEAWALNGDGMAGVVASLPQTLRRMLGPRASLPRTLFTDRGTGMYTPLGQVVNAFAAAVGNAGFRLYWGNNAEEQAPDMGDLLLHETVVAWFRAKMRRTKPQVLPWEETRTQWAARAVRCARAINAEYNVAGLCAEFPDRLQACMDHGGERLAK